MSPTLRHRLSFVLALLAGLWVAVQEPEQRLFERSMRALDLTGQLLGILDPMTAIAVAFLAMLAVYLAVYAALGAAAQAVRTVRGASSA